MRNEFITQPYKSPPDEVSVRKFLLVFVSYFFLILKKWYLILAGFLILGGFKFYQFNQIKETYPAKVKIFVRPQDVAKENKLSVQIFSQLVNSRRLLENLFLEPVSDMDSTLLINEYLETYFIQKPEEIAPEIPTGFQFKSNQLKQLSRQEKMVLSKVMDKVTTPMSDFTDGFISISADYDLGFMTINVATPTEALSLLILDKLYYNSKVLLTENNNFADKKAFSNFATETDSLSGKYKETYYKLNLYRDKRERLIKKENPDIKSLKYLERKIHSLEAQAEIYKTEYLASLEQLKVAQLRMDQNALLIQELESTYPPISPYRPNAKVAGIKGGILGIALAIVLILFARIFKNLTDELQSAK